MNTQELIAEKSGFKVRPSGTIFNTDLPCLDHRSDHKLGCGENDKLFPP
jgi:hypothetical protein